MSLYCKFFLISLGFLPSIHESCPPAYIHCTTENITCPLSNLNVIAYGADGFRWTYKQMNGSFSCHSVVFGDSVIGIAKECCYQSPTITPQSSHSWSWIAGYTACNARLYSYVPDTFLWSDMHIWTFFTFATYNVTFSNCGSSITDTRLHLYDSTGKDITSGSCTGCEGKCVSSCATCYGDNCATDCDNDSTLQEQYTYPSLPPAQYYIKFSTINSPGNYHISIACEGASNFYYDSNILTCSDNIMTGKTSRENNVQYFQVNVDAMQDITFETCGSSYDTTLYIYSDSLYEEQLTGGDNNACGDQESYLLQGLQSGHYYVKIAPANIACDNSDRACFGEYTLHVTCVATTMSPTHKPTIAPTTSHPSLAPTKHPSVQPTVKPTAKPTVTINPSRDPNATPTSPTFKFIATTQRPTAALPPKSPTPPRYLRPTSSPEYMLFLPTVAPKSSDGIAKKANIIVIVAVVLGILICCGFCVVSFLKNGIISKRIEKKRRRNQRSKKKQVIPDWANEGKVEDPEMSDTRHLVRGRTYDRMKSKSKENATEHHRIAVELIQPNIVPLKKGVQKSIDTSKIVAPDTLRKQEQGYGSPPPKKLRQKKQPMNQLPQNMMAQQAMKRQQPQRKMAPKQKALPRNIVEQQPLNRNIALSRKQLQGQKSAPQQNQSHRKMMQPLQKKAHRKMEPRKQLPNTMGAPQKKLHKGMMAPRKAQKSRKPKKMIIKVEEYNPVDVNTNHTIDSNPHFD